MLEKVGCPAVCSKEQSEYYDLCERRNTFSWLPTGVIVLLDDSICAWFDMLDNLVIVMYPLVCGPGIYIIASWVVYYFPA